MMQVQYKYHDKMKITIEQIQENCSYLSWVGYDEKFFFVRKSKWIYLWAILMRS